MITGIYGRQWNNTAPEYAFNKNLIEADLACMNGKPQIALMLYRKEAKTNPIARRRLNMARKQNKILLEEKQKQTKNNHIRLGFIDWYKGYERDIQPFVKSIFERGGISVELSKAENSDILIAGGYEQQLIKNHYISEDKLVVFVSGENISPAYNYHDCSMTTRHSSFCGKNIRLPQWYGDIIFNNDDEEFNELLNPLPRKTSDRNLLISAIYNNSTPERETMIANLRSIFGDMNVHIFGSQRGKNVDKMKILSKTIVNLCFENSIGDGYTTEKLFHSKLMGCKSLYWGDTSYELDFSNKDVHNVKTTYNIDQTIEWCKNAIKNPDHYYYRGKRIPDDILTKRPDLKNIVNFISSWSKIALCWRGFN